MPVREFTGDWTRQMGIVETDETYLTPKKPRKGRPYVKKDKRDIIWFDTDLTLYDHG